MERDYLYMTEYAKSSRASCKLCKDNIGQDSLRMAIMIQSPHFDGKVPHWYHFECFFKRAKHVSIEDIKNIDKLRWEDQEKIKNKLSCVKEVSPLSIEYAKSNRGKCANCEDKIEKNEIRISSLGNEEGKIDMKKRWYHIDCFSDMKHEVAQYVPNFEIEKIPGYDSLSEDDKAELAMKFKSWKSKKRARNSEGEKSQSKKSKNDLTEQLKKQTQMLWEVKDKLKVEVSKQALIGLLEYNNQFIPKGESDVLDAVSDCLVFGCLNACPECTGLLGYSSNRYKCRSMINEWSKCLYETKEVKRASFQIPEEYLDADILKNYEYKAIERVLPIETEKVSIPQPLKGYTIVFDRVTFNGGLTKMQMKDKIKSLGGEVSKTLASHALVLISKKEGGVYFRWSEQYNIDVVSTQFLKDLKEDTIFESVKKHSMCKWGRSKEEMLKLKRKPNYEKFVDTDKSDIQVFTVKGGAIVDPDSNLENKAHLYQDDETKDPLNAILGMTDLVRGSNSFYKLQLLESDKRRKWWVFRSWGRIGTTIGGNKLVKFDDLEEAKENFQLVYLDKTGNHWRNRSNFQKFPNKFVPIDIDYGNETKHLNTTEDSDSKLPLAVQDLMRFIFDLESMKQAMTEFEIDINRMPLGKLSQNQITISYNLLKDLQEILTGSEVSKSKLFELSNRFYTMVPHNFGLRTPPLIDSLTMVKEKCEMLESLMEMEVAYKLMKVEESGNVIDNQYGKLHNCLTPMDKNSDEYLRLTTYLENTHAPTHQEYGIKILEIFDVSRDGEKDRFHSFKKLPNRKMLWHGSRRTNWAGILSQGLRIAPPEAPVTGYMFGKGIYFADMVSKSANYCCTNRKLNHGLLLLCEVALGKMAERHKADENISLNPGEFSCKGIGATIPDPSEDFVDEDGVIYPMGRPIKQKVKSDLLYNEYIVYDVAQVRQRYLFKVQFNYKGRRGC